MVSPICHMLKFRTSLLLPFLCEIKVVLKSYRSLQCYLRVTIRFSGTIRVYMHVYCTFGVMLITDIRHTYMLVYMHNFKVAEVTSTFCYPLSLVRKISLREYHNRFLTCTFIIYTRLLSKQNNIMYIYMWFPSLSQWHISFGICQ